MVLISEVLFFFLKKRSVFGVTLHASNTEHKKKISYLFGGLHRTPNLFKKKYLKAQQVWASKNFNKQAWKRQKNMINDIGKV
jgi:hypothetical protein